MPASNIIESQNTEAVLDSLTAINPKTGEVLPGEFLASTGAEIKNAMIKAHAARKTYRSLPGKNKAIFLRTIANEIENLGDKLITRVIQESGLPEGRVRGERNRTCNQLRLFADLAEEGSWVNAVIDYGNSGRNPLQKPDIRNMQQAVGPVVVFTASNFPLAFSTAGGDTASALAAGCPVIVKAHSSHLGTNALVSEAIIEAARKTEMPDGVFSSLQGNGTALGATLVKHPYVKAVGFTGSFQGGTALGRIAAEREEPIPVFAEMGSNNPIFILPEKINTQPDATAAQIASSVNLGAGQFCTNPGILVLIEDENSDNFISNLKNEFGKLTPATMLNQSIFSNYEKGKNHCLNTSGVQTEFKSFNKSLDVLNGTPVVASTNATTFLSNKSLQEEIFGPFTLVVKCQNQTEMEAVADKLQGQLTATVMGDKEELLNWVSLSQILQEKAGRLIFNGVPTGVEVCSAMHHGGPFPATSDSRYTSVGTSAIYRFTRPIAFQDCPENLLPDELKTSNPLKIRRMEDGKITQP